MQDPKYDHFRWRCFERTGCLLTADGSDDDKVKPEGMPEYVVPPPLPIPAGDDPFESLSPEGEAMPDDIVEVDEVIVNTGADDDAEEEEEVDDGVAIDDEEDRQLDHNLVGLKI